MIQEIKSNSICLFNKYGLSSVSMEQIADTIGVKSEKLSQYYETKELLLISIYDDMYEESLFFSIPKNGDITLNHFEDIMIQYGNLQSKYAFFYNEIVFVVRNYPTIAKLHNNASIQRFKEARSLVNYYIETGIFVRESKFLSYSKLIHSLWVIGTFWQSQKQVINCDEYTESKCHFVDMHWNILLPYLTPKGLEEYHQIRVLDVETKNNTLKKEKRKLSYSRVWRKSLN